MDSGSSRSHYGGSLFCYHSLISVKTDPSSAALVEPSLHMLRQYVSAHSIPVLPIDLERKHNQSCCQVSSFLVCVLYFCSKLPPAACFSHSDSALALLCDEECLTRLVPRLQVFLEVVLYGFPSPPLLLLLFAVVGS